MGETGIATHFVTKIYSAALGRPDLIDALVQTCLAVAEDDEAGQDWSQAHAYPGYTSYASLADLAWRDPSFAALTPILDEHAARFADHLGWDLAGRPLTLDSLWINILEPGGFHSGHIHPHAVLSGTLYLAVPEGAAPIKFEDPRLPLMMAAPAKRADAPQELQSFVSALCRAGTVLLWESWLRHEVPLHQGDEPRISVSFNYRW